MAMSAGRVARGSGKVKPRHLKAVGGRSIQGEQYDASKLLHDYDDKFLDCRGINHPWKRVGLFKRGSEIRCRYVCPRCKTTRDDVWRPDGERITNQYHYPQGYQLRGTGGVSGTDIRKEIINRMRVYASENQMVQSLFGGR